MNVRSVPRTGRDQSGVTLVEMMIAMLLGLLVVGSAIGMFMANSRVYKATESLGRIQENGRIGFELMARDIREADGTPCRQPQTQPALPQYGKMLPIANLLTSGAWWANWGSGIQGFENGALAGSLAGTDAIELHSANTSATTVQAYSAGSFTLSTAAHDIRSNDVVLACDGNQGSIFQAGNVAGSAVPVGAAGNCGSNLGLGGVCGAVPYTYATVENGQASIARVHAVQWYVAANGHGGNSLWQRDMGNPPTEVIDGVRDLELTYLLPGAADYVAANAVGANWKEVTAVRIELELEGQQGIHEDAIKVGTDGQGIRRQITHVVTLRNRSI
ncbi:prepilin-type N-terminal cleavage/methylation domain-containing protein [Lysobacter sp. SG-8]|uniref:Prepilin-type N-terminal cleavage/methylation domain-containing protein n=1 Tax=Marilutibacter penaei TaxID=2759900 RepID=A0A7W3U317_9GAMM|nr:prepilin-type N-terminal cleavage/methylation domain-containing protein [Lysobacter penaei]MBB1088046.1 prepilin-type N-terminal cleavage/methylation domain-containing protein [Lysobacter penaei]